MTPFLLLAEWPFCNDREPQSYMQKNKTFSLHNSPRAEIHVSYEELSLTEKQCTYRLVSSGVQFIRMISA